MVDSLNPIVTVVRSSDRGGCVRLRRAGALSAASIGALVAIIALPAASMASLPRATSTTKAITTTTKGKTSPTTTTSTSTTTTTVPTSFSFSTTPAMAPAFSTSTTDYTVPCTTKPTTVSTTGPGTIQVGATNLPVGSQAALLLKAGQQVQITSGASTYSLRCTPSDLPHSSATVSGSSQEPNGYLTNLLNYVVIFNTQGVPVWWDYSKGAGDAKFLNPTTLTWNDQNGIYGFYNLAGQSVGSVGGKKLQLNGHDLIVLPGGTYLGIIYTRNTCKPTMAATPLCPDLTAWHDPAQAPITDNQIVRFDSTGKVLWTWDTAQHVDIATANTNWHNHYPDVIHMNSLSLDGNGNLVISCRQLDAVYGISMTTGNIIWKLGGSPTPQSLTVIGDTNAQLFSGQHMAEVLPNGDISVYDDGSQINRSARALRFTIDTTKMTATEDESFLNPARLSSPYEGSAEKLPGGDWLANWAGSGLITETSPLGAPLVSISVTLPTGVTPYRVRGVVASITALRAGMNAMVSPLTDVPVATLAAPTPGATVRGSSVTLDASGVDPVGVTSVNYLLTGGTLTNRLVGTAVSAPFGYVAFMDSTKIPNGTYQLRAQAVNAAGNTATGLPTTITISN